MAEAERLRAELKRQRDAMGLMSTPGKMLGNFGLVIIDGIKALGLFVHSHRLFLGLVVLPLAGVWVFTRAQYPSAYKPPLCGITTGGLGWRVEHVMEEVTWWITLGVLSSVGFGTGLHSGLMFLFPHVMNVVLTVESCETLTGLLTWYTHPCKLDCTLTPNDDDGSATFVNIVLKVWPQCFLWGFGTAIGELPPYLVSKAARLAGQKNGEFEEEIEAAKHSNDVFSRLKLWTMEFTKRHGFVGVLILAGWPNAAFDMCGMCCGYLLMPFWTFFPAVVVGKAVIKVTGQACFFVALFGKGFFETVLNTVVRPLDSALSRVIGVQVSIAEFGIEKRHGLLAQFKKQTRYKIPALIAKFGTRKGLDLAALKKMYYDFAEDPEGRAVIAKRVLKLWDTNGDAILSPAELEPALSSTDNQVSLGALDPSTGGTSLVKKAWEAFILSLIAWFVYTTVVQLSVAKQSELDDEEITKKTKSG